MIHKDKQFRLTDGLDCYNPAIVDEVLKFFTLNNVEPRLGRLFSTNAYAIFQNFTLATGDKIVSFGLYSLANRQFSNFYAFSKTSIYWFDFGTGLFDPTPIYTGFPSSDIPYVILPWYDCLYVTKPRAPFVRIERKVVTVIDGAPSARYGIIANAHAYLSAVGDNITSYLARNRWSDLDAPESWEIYPAVSEADFFDLEPESLQITGLSYQRGSPIVYCENIIWAAFYVGFPGGFRHEPLFTGLGNIFHGAVVRNKDVDYFIGKDNIYELNGLQVNPIGTEIYERFIADVLINSDTQVLGYVDSRKNQVFWVYTRNDGTPWSIVYNYLEKKWSERSPQNLSAFFDTPRVTLRGYDVIDNITTIIDNISTLIDDIGALTPLQVAQFIGGPVGEVIRIPSNAGIFSLTKDQVAETFDFAFESFVEVKELVKASIDYVGVGSPNLEVLIGTRSNQSAAISWSAALPVTLSEGTFSFFFRSEAVGKYTRFRFQWSNTSTDYITQLLLLALTKVENDANANPTK